MTGSGPWDWSCAGLNGGTTAQCMANLLVNGSCGSANGVAVSSAPTTGLCSAGAASAVTGSGPWNWTCGGQNGGTTASCSAPLQSSAVNGECGPANGVAVSSAPTTGLCSAGTATAVMGTGPWDWSCTGSNGGTTASCSAPLSTSTVNGQCGPANGTYTNVEPTTNLCSAGTASAVSGNGPWTWSCAGSDGGTTATCEAFTQPDKPGPSAELFANPYYTCNTNYYVSTTGSDTTGNGTASEPWATLNKANATISTSSGPGSWCVNVAPGTYSAGADITRGGTTASSTGYVVYRCETLDGCIVTDPGNQGQNSDHDAFAAEANYIMVDGFIMDAQAPNGESTAFNVGFGSGGGGCLSNPNGYCLANHHIWLLNSIIRNGYAQSGIQTNQSDFIYLIHNSVYLTANGNCGGINGSGISLAVETPLTGYALTADDQNNPVTGDTGNLFREFVMWNVVYNNYIQSSCGLHTDGNGIIADTLELELRNRQ